MRLRLLLILLLPFLLIYCGPNPDEIVRTENRKFNESSRRDDARVREAVDQIKEDSRLIAQGKYQAQSAGQTIDNEVTASSTPAASATQAEPSATVPASTQPTRSSPAGSYNYVIQLASLPSAARANQVVETWKGRGYTNIEVSDSRNANTGAVTYRVRLIGFGGFSVAKREADVIKERYAADIWIVNANREP